MSTTVTYKCPNCDAGLVFDAENQVFSCEFCLSHFTEAELNESKSEERAREAEERDAEFAGEVREYHCASCGAEIIADPNTAADICVYCHNPVVLSSAVSGIYRPSKVIPFKITKDEAIEKFLAVAKKKRFLPGNFFSREKFEYMRGVYYPFWVTDADTYSTLYAVGKNVRTWTSGDYRYTETTSYSVMREGDLHFEDISTSAISTEDKKMLEGILPFPPEEYVDFSVPYLQGFVAKKRDIEREQLYSDVKGRMNAYARDILRATVRGYSHVDVRSVNVSVNSSHWEYSLLPVWMMTYVKKHKRDSKKDKTYMYAMNGATGKIFGKLPISIPKLLALAVGIFLGVGCLGTVAGILSEAANESLGQVVGVSAALGAIAAAIPCIILAVKYNKRLHAPIYPLDKYTSLNLTLKSERFIGRTVTKVRINNNKKR